MSPCISIIEKNQISGLLLTKLINGHQFFYASIILTSPKRQITKFPLVRFSFSKFNATFRTS